MRHDWILGLGAVSALTVLIGIDFLILTLADRGYLALGRVRIRSRR